jgi:conserved oligomeric Golgi complex subunit 3
VVHLCILSLFNASTLLSSKKTRLDADLFLIKHLLILKEQVGAFDIEYVRPETEIDFSGVVDRFWEFSRRESGAFFSPTALRKVVQLPRVVENMLDAKEELDGKLRIAINGFTATTADSIISTLAKTDSEMKEDEIPLAAGKFRETAEKVLPSVQQKTEEYIGDARTTDILVNAVIVSHPLKQLIIGKCVDGI